MENTFTVSVKGNLHNFLVIVALKQFEQTYFANVIAPVTIRLYSCYTVTLPPWIMALISYNFPIQETFKTRQLLTVGDAGTHFPALLFLKLNVVL